MPIQYRRNVDARSDEGLARNFVPHPINTHWPRGFLVLPNEIFAVHIRIISRDWLFASRILWNRTCPKLFFGVHSGDPCTLTSCLGGVELGAEYLNEGKTISDDRCG